MSLSYSEIITSFTIWEFLSELTKSYTQMEIYKAGIIDSNGNFLKDPEDYKTQKERMAGNSFNRLIVVLKRALLTSSDPKIRYAATNPMAALVSLSEEVESYGGNGSVFLEYVSSIFEDGMSVGTGGIAGVGVPANKPEDVVVPKNSVIKIHKRNKTYFDLKEYLNEEKKQIETVGHLPHVGELLYAGKAADAIRHLSATHSRLRGKPVEGHNLSYKADGSVSLVFGKKKGVPYVQYKSGNAPAFSSEKEIDDYTTQTNKPYLVKPFKAALRAASHPEIKPNRSFQADAILRGDGDNMVGNLLKYKPPHPRAQSIFAVHSELDSDTGKKIGSNPDISGLGNEEHHFPNLSLNQSRFKMDRKTSRRLASNIRKAHAIVSDKNVSRVLSDIGAHVDPSSKTGSRSTFMRTFTQAAQERRTPLNMKGFVSFARNAIAKEKNKKQAERMRGHLNYAMANRSAMKQVFKAHRHINKARQTIYDVVTRENTPLSPVEGGVHEGAVSEIAGIGQVKFVPSEFTMANRAQREKFAKKPRNI